LARAALLLIDSDVPLMTAQTMSAAEKFVTANGLTLCCQSFGRPGDPALVLIMGMGAQMIGWDEDFCAAIAGRGFHVVRFDNRDAGRSTRFDFAGIPHVPTAMTLAWMRLPVPAPYLMYDMALDVVGLLDALGIHGAHLVGASMGGAIAQTLAIHFPERVLSITSIMSTTGDPDLPPPQSWALAAVMQPAPREREAYVEHYVTTWKRMRVASSNEDERRDRLRARGNHDRGLHPAGAARQLVAILASGSRRKALRKLTVPSLVIHGDVDPLVPLAAGKDTARSIPDARLMVLEGMGHGLPFWLWAEIIDAIVDLARRAG
jgi:pimeloyl-ACP methyl ester carboxylesterase